jgi:Leucine-rich repeat (LRR) protein
VTGAGLAKLRGNATIELLGLAACSQLEPDDLKHLSEVPSLRVLNVTSTGMGPAACTSIRDISTLTELVISHNPLGDEGLPPLANLPGLVELTLHSCQLTDQGLAALAAFPRLQKLELNGNRGITDKAIPRLAVLRGLTELHVTGTGITRLGVEQLRHQLPRCQVFGSQQTRRPPTAVVDLKGQGASDETLPELLVGKNPWKLVLQGPGITDASLPLVASLPSLTVLELRETSVTDEGLAALAASSTLKRVEFWNMPQITEDAIPHLAAIRNIEWLAFKGTAVYGPGLKPLQGRLRGLAMGHQQLDIEAFQEYIVPFGTLNGLDLAGCRVNDEAVKSMSEQMDISGHLHLGFNPNIKGPGLAHIRDMPRIERLLLTRSGIDDEGLAHLRDATHIRALSVSETAITDASVETLTTLTGLVELDVTDTGITEEGLERLRAALPDAKIEPNRD